MTQAIKHKKRVLFDLMSLCFIIAILFAVLDKYAYYKSLKGKYSITVYRVPMLISSIGGGSDAPGFIILFNKFGIPIRICSVDMVQNVSLPKWREDSDHMKLVFEWNLK